MPALCCAPSIFTYFDFRRFLKDRQRWLKEQKPVFTLDHIAAKLGLRSKGHVSLILKGSKTVPDAKIELLADIFELTGKEKEFFLNLVRYNQELSYRKKKDFLDRMVALMRISDKRLVPDQYRLVEKWYYPIVLEILRLHDFSDDWLELGNMVQPPISALEAKESVQVLRAIKVIHQNDHGFWEPTDAILTFGDGWSSVVGRTFQSHAIEMAQQALVEIPASQRDISTLTVSMSEDTFAKVRGHIQLLRKEILTMVRADNSASKVFQMNFSLFPVSRTRELP
jgi:uncharacterized protein (TIGR02147 family)